MRENLCKMVTHINALNPNPDEKSPEYIMYDALLTDEMVDLVLQMELRTPKYIDELAKILNKPLDYTAKLVDEMVHLGIIEYHTDDDGVDRVQVPIFVPGSFELTAMDYSRTDQYPQLAYAFPQYIQGLTKNFAKYFPMGTGLVRALPVQQAIENDSKKVELEEVSYWVEKYAPSISLAPCECRHTRRMNGEIGHDLEGEWCIQLGYFSESCIRSGKARRITKEECYDILKKAEELGYVHQVTNVDGPDKSVFICNCHWSSCMALRTSWYCNTPDMVRSNYESGVDKDKCVACGQCVEVCPQNAVKLGQKICEKETVEIKKAVIPGNPEYSEKNWRPDLITERDYVVPETGTAPCKTECPAHVAVQGYINLAAQGKYQDALELIKKENPLPAVCGSICNRRCEDSCTRGDVDEPVAIDEIKKFIAEQDLNAETRFVPKKKFDEGKKIAVVGSGPAGLSCAYYLSVLGHQVTVFEKEKKLGGMLTLGIPSFRLEKDIVEAEIEILRELGVKFVTGAEVGKYVTLDELRTAGYDGFYLAIGAQGGRKLGIDGEDAQGVISGIDFLKQVNTGDSVSLSGKTIVIGGGNVAVDVARTAIRTGASTVELYGLEDRGDMPASEEEVQETIEEGIGINNGWGPKRILAENGKVTGIELMRCLSTIDPETGRFNPEYDLADTITVTCDNVLVAIGQSIEWGNLLTDSRVETNQNLTAKTVPITEAVTFQQAVAAGLEPEVVTFATPFEVYQTAEPDVFVGGDVYTGPKFAIDAIAAGKEAAESLHRFVWKGHSLVLGRERRNLHYLDKANADLSSYDKMPRQRPVINEAKANTFGDTRMTLTEAQVVKEAARCLGCGAASVDGNICIGCGLCTTRCKFDAITLEKKYDAWGLTYEELLGAVGKIMSGEGN
ncbi:FAD-dependent oxidoreductase [Acetobacterium wieringae]|uniref:FAD-dependent oxidoreductase n=1 Tax=Acetobacterium wieringae TaxID=52694 RepID=A0ABY6HIJ0_9FIRM|nr:FAD-dependent oxidoreductase [Acetobacterium wieringae]UYO64355.1 FAD-dependent oxidoreductase [Acetobacterium wieringae]VUZ27132.1 Putative thiazole biosynthetic enzyme [Acetobacterium wieringae]